MGPQGAPGIQGPHGSNGSQGPAGIRGLRGPPGPPVSGHVSGKSSVVDFSNCTYQTQVGTPHSLSSDVIVEEQEVNHKARAW